MPTQTHPSAHALIVAHPGHELRVFGWLRAARPVTYVLTDGSGATGSGRVDPTAAILRDAGATRGNVFAALADVRFFARMSHWFRRR